MAKVCTLHRAYLFSPIEYQAKCMQNLLFGLFGLFGPFSTIKLFTFAATKYMCYGTLLKVVSLHRRNQLGNLTYPTSQIQDLSCMVSC